MSGFDLGRNRLHDHDGIVNDEPDNGGDAAQRHQVKAHSQ